MSLVIQNDSRMARRNSYVNLSDVSTCINELRADKDKLLNSLKKIRNQTFWTAIIFAVGTLASIAAYHILEQESEKQISLYFFCGSVSSFFTSVLHYFFIPKS